MCLEVLPRSVTQHSLKVVSQAVLIGALTLFWLHLVVKGWQQAGANQIERAGAGDAAAATRTPSPT